MSFFCNLIWFLSKNSREPKSQWAPAVMEIGLETFLHIILGVSFGHHHLYCQTLPTCCFFLTLRFFSCYFYYGAVLLSEIKERSFGGKKKQSISWNVISATSSTTPQCHPFLLEMTWINYSLLINLKLSVYQQVTLYLFSNLLAGGCWLALHPLLLSFPDLEIKMILNTLFSKEQNFGSVE